MHDMKDKCWYQDVCSPDGSKCSPTCVRYREMLHLFSKSNIPKARWYPDKLIPPDDDYDAFVRLRDIKDNIRDWVQQGNNLYLYSPECGNGKTSWSIKLMGAYFNSIWQGNCFRTRGIFMNYAEFMDRERVRMSFPDDEFMKLRQELLSCDLVVWDDISCMSATSYTQPLFYRFVEARMLARKATIFTGNAAADDLKQFVGERVASRIWNASEVVKFVGQDRRGENKHGRITGTVKGPKRKKLVVPNNE